jgi:hypothetical protein
MTDVQKHLIQALQTPKHDTSTARCLDPDWVYIPAAATDVRKTWLKFGWTPIESTLKEKQDEVV